MKKEDFQKAIDDSRQEGRIVHSLYRQMDDATAAKIAEELCVHGGVYVRATYEEGGVELTALSKEEMRGDPA